jgi:spore germination protein KB
MTSQPKENLSLWQLFVLTLNFELGSAIIVGLGNEAKQDAWVAILIATIYGILLVGGYTFLIKKGSGKNLYEIMEMAIGKAASSVVTIGYVIYFFYITSRVLRDFGELMTSAILPNTPLEVISLTFMLLITYIIYLGLENLGRLTELFTPYILLFIGITCFLLIIGGEFTFKNLQIPFQDGTMPIAKAIFPTLMGFPFGEMIVFTVVISYTSRWNYAGKIGMLAVGIAGFILTIATLLQIGSLGVDQRVRSNFPLLSAIRNVSIATFIERLEAIVVFLLMLGIIVKVSLFFFTGLKGLEHVFRVPYRPLVFPMGMLVTIYSITISENFAEHIEEGVKFVPLYLHIPFQLGFPALTLLLLLWKQRKGGTNAHF